MYKLLVRTIGRFALTMRVAAGILMKAHHRDPGFFIRSKMFVS